MTPFVDLLWLLENWLNAYFEHSYFDEALQPVPKVLITAMGHLVTMLKETVAAGFTSEALDLEASGQGWMERLELNPRCLYRKGTSGSCTDPIRELSDCFLRLINTEDGIQFDLSLYLMRCDVLCSALEQVLANVAAQAELRMRLTYLWSGFRLNKPGPTGVSGQYLDRLVRFYFNSLNGSEAEFALILEAADDAQLPNLLNGVVLLIQLETLALTPRSEVFRAALALAKREFKTPPMVLALVELCLTYLSTGGQSVGFTPSAYYQMGELGFKALLFAFNERCRTGIGQWTLIGQIKRLLSRLALVQDPAVFIRQLFAFAVPHPRSPSPTPEPPRAPTPRLLDENLAFPFFCDFAKPTFEAFPLRAAPALDNQPPQPLNILEAFANKRYLGAVTSNLADVMDLCQTLCFTGTLTRGNC